jgi:hypothetical protein
MKPLKPLKPRRYWLASLWLSNKPDNTDPYNKNEKLFFIKNFFITLIFSSLLGYINYYEGTHGLYFFDSLIPFHYAWLIKHDFRLFSDIYMPPLGPFVAYLVLLSYKIFGISYISSVYLASIISFIFGLIFLNILQKFFSLFISTIFTIAFFSCSFLGYGYLFYNQLVNILLCLIFLISIHRLVFNNNFYFKISSWIIVSIAILIKLHVGFLFLINFLFVEFLIFRKSNEKLNFYVKNNKIYLFFIFYILLTSLFILLTFFGADFNLIIESFKIPKLKSISDTFKSALPVGHPSISLWIPILTFFFFVVNKKYSDRTKYAILLNYLISFAIVCALICYTSGAVMQVIYIFVFSVCLVCYYLKSNSFLSTIPIFITVILSLTIFDYQLIKGGEKSWDEFHGVWRLGKIKRDEIKVENGFLKDIYIRKNQYDNMKFLLSMSKKFKHKKIYYGPEMELFYTITSRVPNMPTLLWSHPSVSFNDEISNKLAFSINNANYDILILSKNRSYLSPYLNQIIHNKYIYLIDSNNFYYTIYTNDYELIVDIDSFINTDLK